MAKGTAVVLVSSSIFEMQYVFHDGRCSLLAWPQGRLSLRPKGDIFHSGAAYESCGYLLKLTVFLRIHRKFNEALHDWARIFWMQAKKSHSFSMAAVLIRIKAVPCNSPLRSKPKYLPERWSTGRLRKMHTRLQYGWTWTCTSSIHENIYEYVKKAGGIVNSWVLSPLGQSWMRFFIYQRRLTKGLHLVSILPMVRNAVRCCVLGSCRAWGFILKNVCNA